MYKSLLIELGQYIAEIEGCEFIGVSDEGEVFVSFHNIDLEDKRSIVEEISDWPDVLKVTEVFSISRQEVQKLADSLNSLLEQTGGIPDVDRLYRSNSQACCGEGKEGGPVLEGHCNNPRDIETPCLKECKQKPPYVCQKSSRNAPLWDDSEAYWE